jgi:hypothetical protein
MNFAYGAETEALRKRLEPVANVFDIPPNSGAILVY